MSFNLLLPPPLQWMQRGSTNGDDQATPAGPTQAGSEFWGKAQGLSSLWHTEEAVQMASVWQIHYKPWTNLGLEK
jgi:hypothetical protein